MKNKILNLLLSLTIVFTFTSCSPADFNVNFDDPGGNSNQITNQINEFYSEVNNNKPQFNDEDKQRLSSKGYEYYSALDGLGRCRYAEACVGTETMPYEDRKSIGRVKPSGWHTIKYDCVDGKYLYNRCHLIAFCLTGENANDHNLITGTRQLNVEAMLPFENKIVKYIENTGNHVMYRVTPIFKGNNLLASEVKMEAQSIEDNTICFNILCYNKQEGIEIDYKTGDSREK